ncbi:hypothetical protein HPCU_06305 [Helicobacter pylori Cuz20]|uniref:Uncharacterized protein n=1 Tax=Helicobacter pylori (strain Cuz20) TaxID=765964 RepID=A0AB32X9W7_HELPC|nr:hypothetical protein HPCU_06305 [Helicobacter pylori Cuz20]
MLECIVFFLLVKGVYQLVNSVFNAYLLGISLKTLLFIMN